MLVTFVLTRFNFRFALICLLTFLTLSPSACGRYQYFINEKLVFSPPALLSNFALADVQLQDCLMQTIEDQGITDPKQLHQLNCSHAGIQSLLGLEAFTGLKKINLDDNEISDLAPLLGLRHLSLLSLNNNQLTTAAVLADLKNLKTLNLHGNMELECKSMKALAGHTAIVLTAPSHCIAKERTH